MSHENCTKGYKEDTRRIKVIEEERERGKQRGESERASEQQKEREREKEIERGGKMAARRTSDTKSKETPSQSAAPPLYHRFLPHRVSSVRPTRAIRIETSFPTKGEGKVGAARRVLGILLCPEIIRIEDEIRVGRRNIFVVGLDLGWRKNSRLRSIFASAAIGN